MDVLARRISILEEKVESLMPIEPIRQLPEKNELPDWTEELGNNTELLEKMKNRKNLLEKIKEIRENMRIESASDQTIGE
jgi:hypothetical protein